VDDLRPNAGSRPVTRNSFAVGRESACVADAHFGGELRQRLAACGRQSQSNADRYPTKSRVADLAHVRIDHQEDAQEHE
jgi:hypothetical protein